MKNKLFEFLLKDIKLLNKYLLIIGIFVILTIVGGTSYALFSYEAYAPGTIHIVFNDTKGPSCSIEITENENADSRTLTLKSSALDVSSSGYSFDGVTYSSTNTKQVTTAGIYTGYVKDIYGNVGEPCSATVIIDITPPTCTLAVSGSGASRTLTINSSDTDLASSPYSFDGTNFSATNVAQARETGIYTVYVKDKVGNIGSCSATVDVTPPTCTLYASGSVVSKTLTISSSDSDLASSPYSFDNSSYSTTKTKTVTTSGTYTAYVKDTSGNVGSCSTPVSFSSPTSYNLISTYTSSQTWTAPEDGYFQIEVFGASGNGGAAITASDYGKRGGGGGGGGGYANSRIKMKKGETIVLTVGGVGSTTKATINSSLESYASPQVTSGSNGGSGSDSSGGIGGAGGVASGGNYSNTNGNKGSDGANGNALQGATGGAGGTGVNGAPNGGTGASIKGVIGGSTVAAGSGSAGFFKIYRSDINYILPTCTLSLSSNKLTIIPGDGTNLASSGYSFDKTNYSTTNTKTVTAVGTYYGYVKDVQGNIGTCSVTVVNRTATLNVSDSCISSPANGTTLSCMSTSNGNCSVSLPAFTKDTSNWVCYIAGTYGWATSSSGAIAYKDGASVPLSSNITLYATTKTSSSSGGSSGGDDGDCSPGIADILGCDDNGVCTCRDTCTGETYTC